MGRCAGQISALDLVVTFKDIIQLSSYICSFNINSIFIFIFIFIIANKAGTISPGKCERQDVTMQAAYKILIKV